MVIYLCLLLHCGYFSYTPTLESQQGVTAGNWQHSPQHPPKIIYLQQGVGREERKEYNC